MSSIRCFVPRACLVILLSASVQAALAAPTIWTGPNITFTKAGNANPTLPANQDHLTSQVAITRGSSQGIYNILQESSFSSISPAGTQWATDINNPAQSITATNYAALSFTNWQNAYGGSGSLN